MILLRRIRARLYPPPRSRILLRPDGALASLSNYKCGFSAMNDCLDGWRTDVHDAGQLAQLDCAVLMIIRDPVRRFQSFLHNWLIDLGPEFDDTQRRGGGNFAYRNLQRIAGQAVHDRVAQQALAKDSVAVVATLLRDVDLEAYLALDPHLHPQVDLLRVRAGLLPVDRFFDLDDPAAMALWSERVGQRLPRVNPSSRTSSAPSEDLVDCVRRLYREDYRAFGDFLTTESHGETSV